MSEEQPAVAGIRFRNAGRISYYDPVGMRLEPGDYVIVETASGPLLGRVVIGTGQVVVNEIDGDLPPILRIATGDDIRRADELQQRAADQLPELRSLAAKAGLDMHVAESQYTLDGRRMLISVAVEQRIDWRQFARDAARSFNVRVEVRSIGSRDRAKLAGGYGICGRELCCSSWLTTFPAISIRMAKNQDRPLNPQKISGLCGRLLCCLSYEDEGYAEMRRTLPKLGQRCSTPTGEGRVVAVNIMRREVVLDVNQQRVVVGDAELGLVVRWDPQARNAPPPPPILPEPEEPLDLEPAAPAASPERPRRQDTPPAGRRAPRRQPPSDSRPAPPQPGATPPKGRRFERRTGGSPASPPPPPTPAPEPPGSAESPDGAPDATPGAARRRRSRNRRGRGPNRK